ncbi:Clo7bot family Cys-rich peptide [Fusibacter sp. JL216-2]
MKLIVKGTGRKVNGFCVTCGTNCYNRCGTQCPYNTY